MKLARIITLMLTVIISISILSASVVSSLPTYTGNGKIDQGDIIHLYDDTTYVTKSCIIGYINKENNRAYTAGHCGYNGESATIHSEHDINVGKFHTLYNENIKRNDIGWIEIPKNMIGNNVYSGNTIATPHIGDQICSYAGQSDIISCSIIHGFDGKLVYSNNEGVSGDSGGPAWIPGKGFVGVYSIRWTISEGNEQNHTTGYNPIHMIDHKTAIPEVIIY